jgi:hypothetical protein
VAELDKLSGSEGRAVVSHAESVIADIDQLALDFLGPRVAPAHHDSSPARPARFAALFYGHWVHAVTLIASGP